ncbi:MAG TPA: response regulator [Acetobacteraceae bacterium]|nr:response regulator [Acetobacteraceae bacterium]
MTGDPVVHVVEDDAAMLDALLLLLRSAGFACNGFANAEAFLAGVDLSQPLCLLTDVRLPGLSGLQLYRHLVSIGCEPVVIVITGHGDVPMAVAALKEGVADFVEKPFDPGVLLESVGAAVARTLERWQRRGVNAEVAGRMTALTPREKEVLDLLVEGHPNKVIATTLGVSIRTTEHHRAHIMEKMGVRTLSQLIKSVLRLGD